MEAERPEGGADATGAARAGVFADARDVPGSDGTAFRMRSGLLSHAAEPIGEPRALTLVDERARRGRAEHAQRRRASRRIRRVGRGG